MSGGGGSTTVQKADPWSGIQPNLIQLYNQAYNASKTARPQYPGSSVVPMNQFQLNALGNAYNYGNRASPTEAAAGNQLQSTLRGDYLYGGKGFDRAFEAASNRIMPQVQSYYSGAGRLDSGLARTAQTQALGDAFASQYGDERKLQGVAASMAPSMQSMEMSRLPLQRQIGDAYQAQDQALQNERVARFNYPRQEEMDRVGWYSNILSGIPGGLGTSTMSQSGGGSSPLAGALGGSLMGAQVGSGLFGAGAGLSGMAALGPLAPWMLGGALLGGML